jgi:hypothetical protein
MRRLAALLTGPEGDIRDDLAAEALSVLSRSELKVLRADLRRRIARVRVAVAVAGETSIAGDAMRRRFPNRTVDLGRDESLGAGVRVRAGDDIMDASVRGYIKNIIEKLGDI